MLQDGALYQKISAAARTMVEQKWKLEPMVSRYEKTYRRILGLETK
jgi:hypothetical protein